MSNIVTRKGPIGDDNKRHTDSPVKDMKKKMAVNAEKEKQAAEKSAEKNAKSVEKLNQIEKDKVDKKDKSTDKIVDKTETKDRSTDKVVDKKEKPTEKAVDKKEKPTEKVVDKKEKPTEKAVDKKEKHTEKHAEKVVEKHEAKKEQSVEKSSDKKEKSLEKKEAPVAQIEKVKEDAKENGKAETPDKKKESKAKQNGARVNGEPVDGAVSSEDEDDQMFPELTYEDSDVEYFEPPTPEGPSRSYTRRSQVKASRTPETPRPASDKQADKDYVPEDSKESKLLKLKEDIPSDRKLRSSDSPRRQEKTEKTEPKKDKVEDKNDSTCDKDVSKIDEKPEIEIAVEVETEEDARKPDTNYSKSRVKVSPYRRSMRLTAPADVTQTSLLANYTGNNTTMEMDITESSLIIDEPSSIESPYLSGLRTIRGRRSYKPLKEMTSRNIGVITSNRSFNSDVSRPLIGTVIGRKRKPEAVEDSLHTDEHETRGKRAKLFERLGFTRSFRFTMSASERLCVENTAEIVGINTDLPLSAPVVTAESFDPESLKHSTPLPAAPTPTQGTHRDKRCSIM